MGIGASATTTPFRANQTTAAAPSNSQPARTSVASPAAAPAPTAAPTRAPAPATAATSSPAQDNFVRSGESAEPANQSFIQSLADAYGDPAPGVAAPSSTPLGQTGVLNAVGDEPGAGQTEQGEAKVSQGENGETIKEYPDGRRESVNTYEKDGVSYTDTTLTTPNGGPVTHTVDADRDGVVDRTRTVTEQAPEDQSFWDLTPEQQEGTFDAVTSDKRDPAQIATTTRSVIDPNSNPPERKLSESRRVSQRIDAGFQDGQEFDMGAEPGKSRTLGADAGVVDAGREINIGEQQSGQFLSHETTTTFDENGKPSEPKTGLNFETRVVGKDADGQDVLISENFSKVHDPSVEGRELTSYTSEERGVLRKDGLQNDFGANVDFEHNPELRDQLE